MTGTLGTEAGPVVIKFVADTTKLLKGYDQAEEALGDFEKQADESKTAAQKLGRQIDSTGTAAQTASTRISKLEDTTESSSDAAKEATEIQVDLTDALQDLGVSAEDAEKIVDGLNTALGKNADYADKADKNTSTLGDSLGKIGGAITIGAVAAAIGKIATAAYQADKEVDDLNKQLAITAGITLAEAQEKSTITESLVDKGYVRADASAITAQIVKFYPEWDETAMQEMAEKYAYFAETQGISPRSIVTEMQSVFDETKWNIQGPEEQAKVMETLYGAISKSSVSFEEFTSLLNEGDNAFKMMGMSAEEAIAYIASQDANLGDVAALINSIDMAIMQKSAELGSDNAAAEWIQSVVDATEGMEDATEIAKVLKTELGVDNERAAKAFAEALSAGTTEVDYLAEEIEAASTPLQVLDESLRSTDVALNRLIESAKDGIGFYAIGDEIEGLILQYDELNRRGGLSEIIGASLRGEVNLTLAKFGRDAYEWTKDTIVNITQNITSPTPVDSYTISNAAERGAKAGARKLT